MDTISNLLNECFAIGLVIILIWFLTRSEITIRFNGGSKNTKFEDQSPENEILLNKKCLNNKNRSAED